MGGSEKDFLGVLSHTRREKGGVAREVVAGCVCCVRSPGNSRPNLQLETQKMAKCLLNFPWELIKSLGFESRLIEEGAVRVMWGGQMWADPQAVHTDGEHLRVVRRLATEGFGNWRRTFDCLRLKNLVVGQN